MQIEKINDNQIRCTLTKEDLARRQLKLNELTYGSAKARELFKDMMNQAYEEVGFESSNIPLMIEAIPVSNDCLVLIITKVEDPEEFDTRFSRFSNGEPPHEDGFTAASPENVSYTPGFSNLLAEDPETLHFEDDGEKEGESGQMTVSNDTGGYHFSSTRKDGDLETTLEISIEKDDPDSVPVDLFNMSAEEMLNYLAARARQIREDLGKNQQRPSQAGSSEQTDQPAGNHLELPRETAGALPALQSDTLTGDNQTDPQNSGHSQSSSSLDLPETQPPLKAGHGPRTSKGSAAASAKRDFRCYLFNNFNDISRLCSILAPFYEGSSSLYRDPEEGSYYLLLSREDSDSSHYKRACTLAADFGKSLDLSYGTNSYFKEHFRAILPEDAVALAASLL